MIKKITFLTITEKQRITETVFGGYGGKKAVGGGDLYYLSTITINNYVHVEFG